MGGPGARFIGAQPGMPGRVVKNAAYSADMITETSQALADGNKIKRTSTSKIYRDSEGRTRREQSLDAINSLAAASNLPPVIFISDPVAGSDYALNPSKKTATKTPRPRGMGEARGGLRPNQGATAGAVRGGQPRSRTNDPNFKTEQLGRQLIEGVPADGTRTTLTIPAGQIGNEHAIQVVTRLGTRRICRPRCCRSGLTPQRRYHVPAGQHQPRRTAADDVRCAGRV